MESMYVTLTTNKSHSINILDLSNLNVSKTVYSSIVNKIDEISELLRQHRWTMTFIGGWDYDNHYVVMRNRNGISLETFKDRILLELMDIVPGNIISRSCILPTIVDVTQLKKPPQNGECLADITLSIRITRNKGTKKIEK